MNIYHMPPQMPRILAEDIGAPELRHPMNYTRRFNRTGFIKHLSKMLRLPVVTRRQPCACDAGMHGQCTGKAMA